MTLTEFLLARIANDERGYRAVYGGHYRSEDLLAFHLAECEAKRELVAEAEAYVHETDQSSTLAERVLAALAAPYADHPLFDPAWAVE